MKRAHAVTCALALCLCAEGTARAHTYTQEWITNWSVCENTNPSTLQYPDDQIANWDAAMQGLGHTRLHYYAQEDVWASDLIEDKDFCGQDNYYSDDSDIYVYSGHGTKSESGNYNMNAWGETYSSPFCKAGSNVPSASCPTWVANTNGTSGSYYESEKSRFGERTSGYASPNQGSLRFVVLATCYSVNDRPDQQWGQSMWYGLDMVVGYRGLSADTWYTDDALSSLAEEAWGEGETMKSAWFYAVDEAWIDDTGGIIASGTSSWAALGRLDWLSPYSPRRPDSEVHTSFAWSYYEG